MCPFRYLLLAINSKTKRWWRCAKLRKIKNVLKREWKKQIINFLEFLFIQSRAHEKSTQKEQRKKIRILLKSRYAKRCFYNNNMKKKKTSQIYCSIFFCCFHPFFSGIHREFLLANFIDSQYLYTLMEIISCSSCPRLSLHCDLNIKNLNNFTVNIKKN